MPDNSVDYGTAKEPNLEEISKCAGNMLRPYNNILFNQKIEVSGFLQLELTPERSYTARSILNVATFDPKEKQLVKIGDLYIILFAPGDGTGKEQRYRLNPYRTNPLGRADNTFVERIESMTRMKIKVPQEYQFDDKSERVLPRDKLKEGVLTEAFFPLFSVEGSQHFPYLVSLEQITVDNNTNPKKLQKGLSIGFNASLFQSAFLDPTTIFKPENPSMELTCGYYRNGQRFGDPHATFYNPKLAEGHPNLMQVAGFLAVESADNPLCKVLDKIGIVPK